MTPFTPLDPGGAALLFTDARSTHPYADRPVTADDLAAVWDLARFPPTAMNANPLRIVSVASPGARERLLPIMAEGNRERVAAAPAMLLLAADLRFHEHIPTLFPARAALAEALEGSPTREDVARFNATLQIGYLLMAIRARGMAACPMMGLDTAAATAEFLPGGREQVLLGMTVGWPAGPSPVDRLPRMDAGDVITTL